MERRAHPRYPLRLNAIAQVEGFPACTCTVRDFCLGGMFLALAPEEMALLSPPGRPLARDTAIAVEVALATDGAQRRFTLQARVARVLEQGLGVAFTDPDPDALMALARRAEQSRQSRPAERAGETQVRSEGTVRRILAAVRQALAERVAGMLVPLFVSAEQELASAANAGGSFVAQGHLLDARAVLRKSAEEIESAFADRVMGELPDPDDPGAARPGVQGAEATTVSELTLIDQASFEDMLAASEIATRAEERYHERLSELQRRLAGLLDLSTEISACPIGPAVFAEAFRQALSERGLHRKALDVLYRIFEHSVVAGLGELYDRVNAVLQEHGVEPVAPQKASIVRHPTSELDAARERRARARASGESTSPLAPPEYGPPPTIHPFPHGPWAGGAIPGAGPGHAAQAQGAPLAFPPGSGPPPGPVPAFAHLPWPGALAAAAAPDYGGYPQAPAPGLSPGSGWAPAAGCGPADLAAATASLAGVAAAAMGGGGLASPAVRPAAAARTLLGLARWARAAAAPTEAGGAPAGAARARAAETPPAEEEVLEALSVLQRAGVESVPDPADPGSSVRGQVLAELARRHPDAAPSRLGPGQEAAFELLDGLLRSVYQDALLLEAVKQRVAGLAVPLHKVALLEEDFLQDPEHPARRMLDQLDRLDPDGGEAPGTGAAWARVDPILERVRREFDRDLAVVEGAARELDAIVDAQAEQYRARVAEVIRASEAQQAMLRARRSGAGAAPPARSPPPELAEWVTQARRLRAGDRLELGVGTPKAQVLRLAWIGEDQESFVLVDRQGRKAATLSLQEVAMQLRRGSARLVQAPDAPLVERALDGVMERVHRRLESEAGKDPTTGLLNAVGFERALTTLVHDALRRGTSHALCYLDLDRLRTVVDVHGPAAASRYVEAVAEALARVAPEGSQVGRLGGDTFAVLLRETGLESARAVAETCRAVVADTRCEWADTTITLTASVGVAPLDGDHPEVRTAVQAAQSACRAAKDSGGDRVRVYEAADAGVRRREDLREALARLLAALDAGRMPLRYQPIVPIQGDGSRLPHIEILLGLAEADGTPVAAGDLIAAAEHYNQAVALDRLVIRETLRWMASHPEDVARLGACAINLSGQSLSDDGLTGFVVDQLMQTRVPPGKVIFEVTETAAVVGLSSALEFIRTLRDLGCRFALDDFGSGHVSYAYLKTLPVDFVKIDGFFVKGMAENAHDYAVVKSIHEIAHVMGKLTVAEYVHSAEIVERLKAIGVDYAQGFLLGEPQRLMAPDPTGRTLPLPAEDGGLDPVDTTLQLHG